MKYAASFANIDILETYHSVLRRKDFDRFGIWADSNKVKFEMIENVKQGIARIFKFKDNKLGKYMIINKLNGLCNIIEYHLYNNKKQVIILTTFNRKTGQKKFRNSEDLEVVFV
jgi:hypothetical protein